MQIHWVEIETSGRLAIAPRPRGHEWLYGELRTAKEEGVDVVLTLLERSESATFGLTREAELAKQAGLEFWWFPVPDRGVPKDVEQATAWASRVLEALHEERSVVIHCRMGIGRSALMAGAVLVLSGHSPKVAWTRLSRAREHQVPDTAEQRTWLEQLAK